MDSTAALPWHWVIETLAKLNQADTSLLKALVTRIPDFLSEAPGPVKERLALRYLEECLGSRAEEGTPPDSPPALGSGAGIDAGLSSEEVLCGHLREVATMGNLKKDTDEPLKYDLRQFILQKKVTLPKSSLELLKDSIPEGRGQPAFSSKEHSRLARCDQFDSNSEGHVRVNRLKLITGSNRIQLLKQTSATLAPDRGCHLVLPVSPGSTQSLHKQNILTGGMKNEINKGVVGTSNDDIQLLKQSSNPQPSSMRNSHVQHAPSNVSRKDANPPLCPKANPDGGMSIIPETSDGDGDHDVSPNIDPNIEILATEKQRLLSSRIPVNYDSMTDDWTERGLCIKCDKGGQLLSCSRSGCLIAVHESCLGSVPNFEEAGLFYCPFCSYTRAFNVYRKVKRSFSQARKALSIFIGRDGTHGIQKNLSPARVSGEVSHAELVREKNNGCNVQCNHCEKASVTATVQPKQAEFTSMSGKGNLSSGNAEILCRRYDVSQSGGETNDGKGITKAQHYHQTEGDNISNKNKLPCEDAGPSPIHESSDAKDTNRPNGCVGVAEHQEQAVPHAISDYHQTDGHNILSKDKLPCDGAGSSPIPEDAKHINRPAECVGVPEHQDQAPECHATPNDDSIPCNKDDKCQTKDPCDVTKAKRKCQILHEGNTRNQDQEKTIVDHEIINSSNHDVPSSRTSEKHAKRKRQGAAETEKTRKTRGIDEDQNTDKSFSGKHSKHHVPSKQHSDPITPHGRRAKLFWTSEEEEALKIAVQKFAVNSDGSYPWTKILEFGRHVFHNTRQPCDLKDKWRNIRIKEGLKTR